MRKYDSKHFKFLMRKLKKEGLWEKFRILEYYFRYYKEGIRTMKVFDCLRYPERYEIEFDDISRTYKLVQEYGTEKGIILSDFFKIYSV